MPKNICVIDGHPDADSERFVHALCHAYRLGAASNGHSVASIRIADLAVKALDSVAAFTRPPSELILHERKKIAEADHIMLAFPLWLGSMPAATRGFFEQVACGGFFLDPGTGRKQWPRKMMKGKSARVVVTMGMPAVIYKTLMGSGSLKALERGMLGISGFKPVRHSILGGVDTVTPATRQKWLDKMQQLGSKAQ